MNPHCSLSPDEGSYGSGNARIPHISARLGREHKKVRIPTAKYC